MAHVQRKRRKWPKVIRIFITAVLLFIVLLSASYLVLKIVADKNGTFPGLFGVEFATEMTERMEPKIEQGSFLIMKPTQENEVGDVVVYTTSDDRKQYTVAEIVEKDMAGGIAEYHMQYVNGSEKISEAVLQEQIGGKVHYAVSYLGYIVDFIDTIPGILTVIVLPCLIIIVMEIIRMVRIVRTNDGKEEDGGNDWDLEQDQMFHVDNSYFSATQKKNSVFPGTYFRDLSPKEKELEQPQDVVSQLAGINNQVVRADEQEQVLDRPSAPEGQEKGVAEPLQKSEEDSTALKQNGEGDTRKILTDVDRMIQEILGAERVPSDVIQRLKTIQSEKEDSYHGLNPEIGSSSIQIKFGEKVPKSVSVIRENEENYLVVVTDDGETKIRIDF